MDITNSVVVVTGAAGGIGKALAEQFHAEGARLVVCADMDQAGAEATAASINGVGVGVNVANEADIQRLIEEVEEQHGPIDIFCSNAGILGTPGGPELSNEHWQNMWEVNVMSHIYAARHVVPRMQERGKGYLLNTASAAGLLSQVGVAPYAVTKHAAVGFAEWLALTYGDDGIGVSVLCPQAVRTAMTQGHEEGVASIDGMLEPKDVAEACMQAIKAETFLVLPHPEVLQYMQYKTADYDRWLGGMRKLNRHYNPR